MAISRFSPVKLLPLLVSILFKLVGLTTSNNSTSVSFLECFTSHLQNSNSSNLIILTRNSSAYSSVLLQSSIQNFKFFNISTPKPEAIVIPSHGSHVQAAVICSKKKSIQVRTRSGSHDYEGLPYVTRAPYVIIDLVNLHSIDNDVKSESAWVESGATLGELYYKIAEKTKVYGFPAGFCLTAGVGGHISGGGSVSYLGNTV